MIIKEKNLTKTRSALPFWTQLTETGVNWPRFHSISVLLLKSLALWVTWKKESGKTAPHSDVTHLQALLIFQKNNLPHKPQQLSNLLWIPLTQRFFSGTPSHTNTGPYSYVLRPEFHGLTRMTSPLHVSECPTRQPKTMKYFPSPGRMNRGGVSTQMNMTCNTSKGSLCCASHEKLNF